MRATLPAGRRTASAIRLLILIGPLAMALVLLAGAVVVAHAREPGRPVYAALPGQGG